MTFLERSLCIALLGAMYYELIISAVNVQGVTDIASAKTAHQNPYLLSGTKCKGPLEWNHSNKYAWCHSPPSLWKPSALRWGLCDVDDGVREGRERVRSTVVQSATSLVLCSWCRGFRFPRCIVRILWLYSSHLRPNGISAKERLADVNVLLCWSLEPSTPQG